MSDRSWRKRIIWAAMPDTETLRGSQRKQDQKRYRTAWEQIQLEQQELQRAKQERRKKQLEQQELQRAKQGRRKKKKGKKSR